MYSGEEQELIRAAMFEWLTEQSLFKPWLTRRELREGFFWRGNNISLMDWQRGIWNPAEFDATVSITSTLDGPYDDVRGASDFHVNYAYQTAKNGGGTNIKLRVAFETHVPLILFEEFEDGKYIPKYPVYVTNDFFDARYFEVDLSGVQPQADTRVFMGDSPIDKAYAERTVLQRIHQPRFRARVIHAYNEKCTVCKLKHVELLDAAHIIPDAHENGFAAVTNGLALCKIHHAAYDKGVLGISPDFTVVVKPSVMGETDGPMLKYGIQAMNGIRIELPRIESNKPSKENLDARFQEFLKAC